MAEPRRRAWRSLLLTRPSVGLPRVIVSIYDDPANPYYGGGGPTVVRRIARELRDRAEVVVITGGSPGARVEERDGATWVPLPLSRVGPRLGQLLYTLLLLLIAPVARYDLWVESSTPPFTSSFLPYVTRRPVLGLVQARCGREMERQYRLPGLVAVERRALRRYADIVVLNAHDGEQLRRDAPRTRVHVIPNVTADPAPAGPSRPAGEGRTALYLGRIELAQKGLGQLLDACGLVRGEALPLVIAGSGRDQDERALREALAVSAADARWVGPLRGAETSAALETCGLLVVPSRSESFCLAALEALAHGRPVVHFALPQLSWIPADCGIAVPCFDTAALAEAVRALSVDPALRSLMGTRARAFAVDFLHRHGGCAYADLVAQLLDPGGRVPQAAEVTP